MTAGQVAGLLAAFALLVLVIFIGIFLVKTMTMITQVNQSLKTITKNVDGISKQSEKILSESRNLLGEVDREVKTLHPMFKAGADLGQSVSNVNSTVNSLKDRFKRHRRMKRSRLYKIGSVLVNLFSLRKHK